MQVNGRLRSGVVVVAALALLAGCSSGGKKGETGHTSSDTGGEVVQGTHVLAVVDVHLTEYRIEPRALGLERTGYFGIRAINDGTVIHGLVVSGPGLTQRTADIAPGKSETMAVLFPKPGLYRMYCPIAGHEQRGMKATIRVR